MDPLAALRCWKITVDLIIDGQPRTYQIPALPATDWLEAVLTADALAIVPGLVDDPDLEPLIIVGLAAGTVTADDVKTASRHALEEATGWRWWEAQRLIHGVCTVPAAFGRILERLNLDQVSIGAFCTVAYATISAGLNEKNQLKFDQDLSRPPPEEAAQDEPGLEAGFFAALAEHTSTPAT